MVPSAALRLIVGPRSQMIASTSAAKHHAGPEECVCKLAAKDIVMVTGTTCSLSTKVNNQAVAFTGIVVTTCP